MQNLTPRQIVAELDRHIIGQQDAKRAVAIAIRNRWRRQQLAAELAREISPKNIIMIGPTGVGKTEIARRIASIIDAPFVKVEASKYTEVGYHGRDVESMIRDLLDNALSIVRQRLSETVKEKARQGVDEQLLDLLLPDSGRVSFSEDSEAAERRAATRNRLRQQLESGALDERQVEITTQAKAVNVSMFSNMGMDQMDPDMAKMFENLIPDKSKRRKMTIREARSALLAEETDKLIDREKLTSEAISLTEQTGIIFIDEIDKIAGSSEGGRGPDVSRQGVQRDLLPIVEGSAVTTRHGIVNTDHILFIAAGAFHSAAVSDLMPELQGRFPIRVELQALTREDFVRILTEPHNSLTRQQAALLGSEKLEIHFEPAAIQAMAELAAEVNSTRENIGARRLMTIMEKLFEQINYDAPDMAAAGQTTLTITEGMVREKVGSLVANEDLSRYVL